MPDTQTVTLLSQTKPPAIGHLVNSFRNTKAADPKQIAEAFDVITAILHKVVVALTNPAPVAGQNSIAVAEYILAAATTDIVPPLNAFTGALLSVIITVDSTAGREITWDATGLSFKGVGVDDIDNGASKVNAYLFVGRADGNWWCTGMKLGM